MSMHDNPHYLEKKEQMARENIAREIGEITKTIKLFLFTLMKSSSRLWMFTNLSEPFKKWKEMSINRLGFY